MTRASNLAKTGEVVDTGGYGYRNRIINGGMLIDQRNAGASVTQTTSVLYTVDRWASYGSVASKFTIQQNAGSVTPPAGYTKYLGITSSSAYTVGASEFFFIQQVIEGYNIADLGFGATGAQTVTLSFWVRSSLTGTFGGTLSNDATNRVYPFTYTISSANTWTAISVTVAGDTSGTWQTTTSGGLVVNFNMGTGATVSGTAGAWSGSTLRAPTGATSVVGTNGATFYITGVQLEAGSLATAFERRPYGMELQLCQRYYEKSYPMITVPGSANIDGATTGLNNTSTASGGYVGISSFFAVRKRTAATVSYWDAAGNASRISNYSFGGLVRTDNNNSAYSFTGGESCAVMYNNQAAASFGLYNWVASAEL
jgi:hypothetical protein